MSLRGSYKITLSVPLWLWVLASAPLPLRTVLAAQPQAGVAATRQTPPANATTRPESESICILRITRGMT